MESQVGGEVKKSGSRMGGLLGGAIKKGAATVAVAAGVAVGTALFSGFKRLDAIDQATAKLEGLGHSAKGVSVIMDNALASVKGTAFGLDEAATTAASVVAAGIKPGKELTAVLKTVADTATIAGKSMADTGAIFGSVAARGKLQGDDLMQLQSVGVPVLSMLAKHYGITAAAASEMVSKGQVDFKNFATAMHQGIGGAALASGKTFKGAFANLKASVGRIGANLLSGLFPQVKAGVGKLTTILSGMEPAAARIGEAIGKRIAGLGDVIGPIASKAKELAGPLKDIAKIAWGQLQSGADALRSLAPSLKSIAEITWGKLQGGMDALKSLTTLDFGHIDGKALGTQLGTAIAEALNSLMALSVQLTAAFGRLFAKIDWVGIGITVGKQVPAMLLGLAAGLANFDFGSLLTGIKEHWGDILIGVLVIAFAPAKIGGALARILAKIPFVGRFLAMAVTWLNELGGKLTSFGGDLMKTFWSAFTKAKIPGGQFVTKVLSAIKGLPGAIAGFFARLQIRIGLWALDAFKAAGTGAGRGVVSVLSLAARLPGMILRAIGSLARLLFPRGAEMMRGLGTSVSSGFAKVAGIVHSIPGRILSALGDLGGLLFSKGASLVQGLINGITSKIAALGGAIGKVAGKVKGFFPGSPIKEGPLKSWNNGGAGKRLMASLGDGVKAGTPAVIAHIRKMAKAAAAAAQVQLVRNKKTRADMGRWVESTLLPGLSGTESQVKSAVKSLAAKVQAALVTFAGDSKAKQRQAITAAAAYMKSIRAQTTALARNADYRLAVADRLKEAQKAVEDAVKVRADFAKSVADTARSFASLMSTPSDADNPLTGSGIVSFLTDQLKAVKDFAANMASLLGKGLNKGTYEELVKAGPEQGAKFAQALLDEPSTISAVNSLTSRIGAAANTLGETAGNELYQAGVATAEQFAIGLQTDLMKLESAGAKMGAAVSRGVRSALGLSDVRVRGTVPKIPAGTGATSAAGTRNQPIVLQLDGKTLWEGVVGQNGKMTRQTGRNAMAV